MKAVTLQGYGGVDRLALSDLPEPAMKPHNEVRIEVHAAGVNPFDVKLRNGALRHRFPISSGHVLGCDVAGIIVERGFDVSHVDVGDRVYALLDPMRAGSYAETVVTPSWLVRKAPESLDFEQAASVPMAGCTAWVALSELSAVSRGAKLLLTGAAGGVGSFAVQLAKRRGAHVLATASPDKHEYLRRLGADEVSDYTQLDSGQLNGVMDVIIDTKGGSTHRRCQDAMAPGGLLLSVQRGDGCARDSELFRSDVRSEVVVFDARPDALEQLGALFDSGGLRPPALTVFPLEQFAKAHELVESGLASGKIVLKVR